MASEEGLHTFGQYKIRNSEVFCESPLSLAFVNLKPVVPGHVLVIPRRVVRRFQELRADEVADLWTLAQKIGPRMEAHFAASSLTLAIQDGPAAGQSVFHVHIHVLPRKAGDFANNDDIYDEIDKSETSLKQQLDSERKARTPEEMASEAASLRAVCEGCGWQDTYIGDS